jgi:hypothetical protein
MALLESAEKTRQISSTALTHFQMLSFCRCCQASMNALFGDKAKRNVLSQAQELSGNSACNYSIE